MRYRKGLFVVVLVLLMAVLLSGCVQMVIGAKVNEDGTGSIRMQTGILETMVEEMGDQIDLSNSVEGAKEQGYTVTPYTSDGYTGYVYEKSFANLNAMNDDEVMSSMQMQILVSEEDGKKVYTWQGQSDVSEQMESESGMSIETLQQAGNLDLRFILTMPYPITQTNATSLSDDKMTATWNLLEVGDGAFMATAVESAPVLQLWMILLIAVAVIVIVVVVLIVVFANKKKRQIQSEQELAKAQAIADKNAAQDAAPRQTPDAEEADGTAEPEQAPETQSGQEDKTEQ